jgi:hypothetical protein
MSTSLDEAWWAACDEVQATALMAYTNTIAGMAAAGVLELRPAEMVGFALAVRVLGVNNAEIVADYEAARAAFLENQR